jgi:GDP-D-mannose dehydratase
MGGYLAKLLLAEGYAVHGWNGAQIEIIQYEPD